MYFVKCDGGIFRDKKNRAVAPTNVLNLEYDFFPAIIVISNYLPIEIQ